MDGMSILLNSLGINPDLLKNAAEQVQTVAVDFQARLTRIETKIDFLYLLIATPNHADITMPNPFVRNGKFEPGGLTNGRGDTKH